MGYVDSDYTYRIWTHICNFVRYPAQFRSSINIHHEFISYGQRTRLLLEAVETELREACSGEREDNDFAQRGRKKNEVEREGRGERQRRRGWQEEEEEGGGERERRRASSLIVSLEEGGRLSGSLSRKRRHKDKVCEGVTRENLTSLSFD